MIKTATNFIVGFFGVPESTSASRWKGQGSTLQAHRIKTVSLGSSKFCELFTEEDFEAFEYGYDLSFYGDCGLGSPVGAAQGLGWVREFVARLSQTPMTVFDSNTNSTLDGSNITFPLDQAFYADAAHEVSILNALAALNLTALSPAPLDPTTNHKNHTFSAARIVPFATNLVIQVLECQPSAPTKQIRMIVNDAVIPLETAYEGCKHDFNGLCAFDTVVAALQKRISEIDYEHDCFGNYSVPAFGTVTNGRAPAA
ncbi:hypothetical protein RQP46_000512 [Phenoliferia psychrophenolica]